MNAIVVATAVGVGGGALLGGVIGDRSGAPWTGALVGGVVGGAGAALGTWQIQSVVRAAAPVPPRGS